MQLSTALRDVPDQAHASYPELFGGEDHFELSTIRPEDASIAIEMLIGNYSSPMDAVIRELVVNAIDAHRAAGTQQPVQVTMPTETQPFFIVSDRGLGLSPTDMVGVYTRPAASTKRGENQSTGGLGIGAKAPFTLVDRFMVRGVKDGVAATLTMARIDGQLKHRIDNITAVRENTPNCVEVIVPVESTEDNLELWWKALSRVHFWWDAGLVEIVNQADAPVNLPQWQDRLLAHDDSSESRDAAPQTQPHPIPEIVVSSKLRKPTILMGQIAYQVPYDTLPVPTSLLYRLPVGTVAVAPTRESIVDNPENRKVLRDLYESWAKATFEPVIEQLRNEQTSIWSLWLLQRELRTRGLMPAFETWIRGNFNPSTTGLPAYYVVRQLTTKLVPGHWSSSSRLGVRAHGVPDQTAAKMQSLGEFFISLAERSSLPPIVFCDDVALPPSKRSILSRWAREQNVIVAAVHRDALERALFGRHWTLSRERAQEHTRPFADPDQLEWIDPADVKVARAPKARSQPVHYDSLITVQRRPGTERLRQEHSMTVRELAHELTQPQKPKRYVIIDTAAQLTELPQYLPENISIVGSGQRPARLLRELAGKHVLDVQEFTEQQVQIVEQSLSQRELRRIGDIMLCRESGIRQFFAYQTGWIDEIDDPAVRGIARKISKIAQSAKVAVNEDPAARYHWALQQVTRDADWLVEHSTLGKYLPALLAAQSRHIGRRTAAAERLVVQHIIRTIETQLM